MLIVREPLGTQPLNEARFGERSLQLGKDNLSRHGIEVMFEESRRQVGKGAASGSDEGRSDVRRIDGDERHRLRCRV